MCCPYGSVPGPAVRSGPACRRRRKERSRRVSSVNLAAAGLAAGCAHNKKLLEPCGCQESSADTCPLALREGICGYGELHRLNFNRLSVRHTAATGNGGGPELLRKAGRRHLREEQASAASPERRQRAKPPFSPLRSGSGSGFGRRIGGNSSSACRQRCWS